MKTTKNLTRKSKLQLQRDVIRVLETKNLQHAQGGIPKILVTTGSDQMCCA